jgi:hypothetical protein
VTTRPDDLQAAWHSPSVRECRPRANVEEYLARLDPVRPYGLIFGFEQAAPRTSCPHGWGIVQRLSAALNHELRHDQSVVLHSPVDVILDAKAGLVLHPAVAVVMSDRRDALRAQSQVWGAPHVVMELLWPATARRVRCTKIHWYRNYGVDECWLIDARHHKIEVFDFRGWNCSVPYVFSGVMPVESRRLGRCNLTAQVLFAGFPSWQLLRTQSRPY